MYMVKPWFTDWLEGRKELRAARIKREDEESRSRTEELRQARADAREENEKTMLAMEQRGIRETSHIQALNAVAAGQAQNLARLERFENEILKSLRDTRGAMKAVLRKLDEDFDFEVGENGSDTGLPAADPPRPGGAV